MSESNRHSVPARAWVQWSEPERIAFNRIQDEVVHDIIYGTGTVEPVGILRAHLKDETVASDGLTR